MRINQLQNLCWAANVLVFAGMGWAGFEFYEAFKTQKDLAEIEWPESPAPPPVSSWPPGIAQFVHIHKTHIHGLVPEPPKPPVVDVVEQDPWTVFSGRLKLITGFQHAGDPARSSAHLELGTQKLFLQPGDFIEDYQCLAFDRVPRDGETPAMDVLVFENTKTGTRHSKTFPIAVPDFLDRAPLIIMVTNLQEPFAEPDREDKLVRHAFRDEKLGCFVLPWEEVRWLRAFGDKVFEAARVTAQAADGPLRGGVLFTQAFNSHRTLRPSHGLVAGDLVVAVDGQAVTDPAELLRYFQGWVPGVRAFELTVVREGKERTESYQLSLLVAAPRLSSLGPDR